LWFTLHSGFLSHRGWYKKNLINSIREGYSAELRLEKVEVNPFVLSLRLNGIELDDPAGAPVARVDEFFVNFQLSSLFRRAWTFDENMQSRISIGETTSVSKRPGETIKMKMSLSTGDLE